MNKIWRDEWTRAAGVQWEGRVGAAASRILIDARKKKGRPMHRMAAALSLGFLESASVLLDRKIR